MASRGTAHDLGIFPTGESFYFVAADEKRKGIAAKAEMGIHKQVFGFPGDAENESIADRGSRVFSSKAFGAYTFEVRKPNAPV